ncbi:Putative CBF1-interacting co-repressor CIR domain, leukocyte receptor cluster member 1 [Septoria linicola]|uniref:CBF1-interacting co-repressor CIR domain, leukocyte receptor cluster member 1 n=1 Tax=Septoria linicola TaxID=215465 RepID=A0A9Q9EPB7_9PEZI|nr:Putative CBF1-interacting co-repressor CIR domain, leukocyte receptor cluster member 1 [Septoria linicola]
MVLHLLGKKSWNVYNHDNIDRVRKDEAEAKAREEAAEQRMQEEDAARRIAILRGEAVPALPESQPDEHQYEHHRSRNEDYATRDRKRKRRHGEDDTDRDIRYARQDREVGEKAKQTLSIEQIKKGGNVEAPLQDHAGHIQLFAPPEEKDIRARQKNEEAEAEKAKKRKREEDLVTMKFSNAAGYNNGMQKPWYAAGQATKPVETASRNEVMLAELKGKDVWGTKIQAGGTGRQRGSCRVIRLLQCRMLKSS